LVNGADGEEVLLLFPLGTESGAASGEAGVFGASESVRFNKSPHTRGLDLTLLGCWLEFILYEMKVYILI
jgi:hypothetical protein